ncbi:MAG: hypothetical protein FGM54_06855 [Chitinophagaceae bacterium]|nr:hypothetical protein [Chitinophagaceae bacterium]
MKKNRVAFALALFSILACNLNAQSFKGNFSGMIGIPNVKVRIQYEHPISNLGSVGLNTNYHFFNWRGPMVEPFGRLYAKKHGNIKGGFGQLKFCYGNFSYYEESGSSWYNQNNGRFSVFGMGLGGGYKFLVAPHVTIEPYGGLRIISGPPEESANLGAYERLGWYFWTGFPLELHAKLGYQF